LPALNRSKLLRLIPVHSTRQNSALRQEDERKGACESPAERKGRGVVRIIVEHGNPNGHAALLFK